MRNKAEMTVLNSVYINLYLPTKTFLASTETFSSDSEFHPDCQIIETSRLWVHASFWPLTSVCTTLGTPHFHQVFCIWYLYL